MEILVGTAAPKESRAMLQGRLLKVNRLFAGVRSFAVAAAGRAK